jgi:Ca2+-binding RTX toxin-like protein
MHPLHEQADRRGRYLACDAHLGKVIAMRRVVLLLASISMALLLASGVALAVNQIRCDGGECLGTPRNDEMLGSLRHDVIYALKGDDRMWGRTGGDDVYGFNGNDWATGGSGIDKVSGGDGRDTLLDGPHQDSSRDAVNGGNGRDTLISRNAPASVDVLNCGAGHDIAKVDNKDIVSSNCEDVRTSSGGGGGGY